MNKQLKTETLVFKVDSEQLAMDTIEEYKNNQTVDGYTLTKYNTTYKSKKDRKTHEIIDEFWLVSVTKEYEVM
jgi:hypothetical protein